MSWKSLKGVNITTTSCEAGYDDSIHGVTDSSGKIIFNVDTFIGVWEADFGDYAELIVNNVTWNATAGSAIPATFMVNMFDDASRTGNVWNSMHKESEEFTISNTTYKLIVDWPSGTDPSGTLQFLIKEVSIDDILSHLADINWPYPTGTVHYYDTSLIDLKTQLHNTPRYAGSELEEGKKCVTNAQYSTAAFYTEHITSNGLVWDSTNIDASKSSYFIHKTSTYVDIYLTFYLKTTITSKATWTIAFINSSVINYGASYNPVYYGCVMNDGYGSFSTVYLTRIGSSGDAGNLRISGMGGVMKGKGTSGIGSSYANYATIRLIPNSYNSADDYDMRSIFIGQTIEDV